MRYIVIGAGLSGLAAAHRIRRAGHEVVVLEAADQPGGRCRLDRTSNRIAQLGFIVDTGPELAASSYRHWLQLAEEVGLGPDLVDAPSRISILKNGRPVEIDLGKPLQAAMTPLLGWRDKARFARGFLALRGRIRSVPPFLLDGEALDDPLENAQDLAVAAFGREAALGALDAVLRPLAGTRGDLISTLLVYYVLAEWAQMKSLMGGLQRLPLAVAERLDVRYGAGVESVVSGDDGVTVAVRRADGSGETLAADKCLIATQFDDALRIFPRLEQIDPGYGAQMTFLRMLDIKLGYGVRPATRSAMVMCPYREQRDICVISLSHNKAPDRAPPGHSLFSIFTEHLEFDRFDAMDDGQVLAVIRPQLEGLFPELEGHLLFSRIGRHPRVCMVPTPGYFRRTRRLWDAVGEEPRVHLAGDIFNFGSMEAAVSSGNVAADRLMAR
ncbi:MAG TPA: NAD(P)/FAD-dependent oxidoreductase [Novosphingobium sp.]|nr:NAD(P)/FAD-dependent oxidoreductase [Novosphingobium sp.]